MAKERTIRVSTIKTMLSMRLETLKAEAVTYLKAEDMDNVEVTSERIAEVHQIAKEFKIKLEK